MRKAIILVALLLAGCRTAADANARGRDCYGRGAYPCAVREFSVAVKAEPENPRYHFNLALALGRSGMHDQAITELQETLRLDPAHEEARKTLARVQNSLREAEAALVAERFQRPAY